jgi:[methyl-Co(III) methanol-specific corrinoid protein]:coenzyme M methyltransferase
MEACGVFWPEAHRDPEKMATLAAQAWEQIGIEGIGVPFCQTVELEVLGCEVNLGTEKTQIPGIATTFPGYHDASEVKVPENLLEKGRIPVVSRALELLEAKYDSEVPIRAHLRGPFSIASRLKGLDQTVMMMLEDPEGVKAFVDLAQGVTLEYGRHLLDHGAEVLSIEEMSAAGNILGADLFRQFVQPALQETIRKLKAPVLLHICGYGDAILPAMVETGASALSIDRKTDARKAVEAAGGKVAVMGNVDASRTLGTGGPEAVRQEALEALEAGVDILAPGCLVPPTTPNESLKTMVEAVKGWKG